MKITISPTTIVRPFRPGQPEARIWIGTTDQGTPIAAHVAGVSIPAHRGSELEGSLIEIADGDQTGIRAAVALEGPRVSEALYAFAAAQMVGAAADCAWIVEAVELFCRRFGFEPPRPDWAERFPAPVS